MYSRLTSLLLKWLRVPPEPQPPHGHPASLRLFRAGHNFFKLRLARWALTQVLALAGILFWIGVFIDVEAEVHAKRAEKVVRVNPKEVRNFEEYIEKIGAAGQHPAPAVAATPAPATNVSASEGGAALEKPAPAPVRKKDRPKPLGRIGGWGGFKLALVQLALWLPPWALPLLWVLKGAGILAYLVQLPVTYAIARLDFEMRWYMVTDRSLRIRHGVWKVSESTMSFANIQQVEVSQGPLQRMLGLADVRVQSAGGGGGESENKHGTEDDMHHGLFHGVTNAPEIRDLILERLRRFRESGLGDPEEAGRRVPSPLEHGTESAPYPLATHSPELLAAAQELAAEARALRSALG